VKYALLINLNDAAGNGASQAEQDAITEEYMEISRDSRVVGGEHLQPVETATTVRVHDGEALTTDGPFADTKEWFGGFFLLEAGNLDEAIEVAARIPAARMGGSVEVRPVVEH
jgi:hypothetical protein